MKTFISFFVVAILIGSACYALFYWVIKMDYIGALSSSIAVAVSGLVVDYLMKYTNSKKRNRVKEH